MEQYLHVPTGMEHGDENSTNSFVGRYTHRMQGVDRKVFRVRFNKTEMFTGQYY